ncbi:MAG: beta-lactamase family protein [Paludibacteraceae bacterium]|nr:beta-lactamase family protein [Paludibacteraceae bacterium]
MKRFNFHLIGYLIRVFSILFPFVGTMSVYGQIGDLRRVSPESQGLKSEDVKSFFDGMMAAKQGEPHGVMVLRNGEVVGELFPTPFASKYSHTLYSASKTFVAVAVGLAVDENRLRLTDRVATFFPEMLPDTVSEDLANMTVRDLLTMTSGIRPDWLMRTSGANWVRRYLRKTVLYHPGEHFDYDSMSTYLLSAILQKVTGMKLLDYLRPRLFEPMHITEVDWEESPEGINTGGWGLHLQVASMAKFGQLLLNRGKWGDTQLVSAKWVDEMTSALQVTGMADAYGYQVWRCDYPEAYRADGALGQYIIVAPREQMVVAITQANIGNGVAERQLVWNLLRTARERALPEGKGFPALLEAERRYQLPVVPGKGSSKIINSLVGKELRLNANGLDWKSVKINISKKGLSLTVTNTENQSYQVDLGRGEWRTSHTEVCPPYTIRAVGRFSGIKRDFYVAGCYGGESDLTIRLRYTNWVSGMDLVFSQTENGSLRLMVKETAKRGAYELTFVD